MCKWLEELGKGFLLVRCDHKHHKEQGKCFLKSNENHNHEYGSYRG